MSLAKYHSPSITRLVIFTIGTKKTQMVNSPRLKLALAHVLALGNVMNEGHVQRGAARGFGLEALSLLMSIRSTATAEPAGGAPAGGASGTTLMHFLAELLSAAAGADGCTSPGGRSPGGRSDEGGGGGGGGGSGAA